MATTPDPALLADLRAALDATYAIEREIGGGGMSRVFLADERSLGRRVVLKVLPPRAPGGGQPRAVPPRNPVRRAAPAPPHRPSPRRGTGGGHPLLHDAVRRGREPPQPAREGRPDAGRAGAGDPGGRGGRAGVRALAGPGAPRHQAGE